MEKIEKETLKQKEIVKEKPSTEKGPIKKKAAPARVVLTEEEIQLVKLQARELVMKELRESEASKIRDEANALEAKFAAEKETERLRSILLKESRRTAREKQRIKENKIIKGMFHYHAIPNGKLNFPYRKWEGDKIRWFSLVGGTIVEIPIGVAVHINENINYSIFKHREDKNGKEVQEVGSIYRRASFHSHDVVDTSDPTIASAMGPLPFSSTLTRSDGDIGRKIPF